MRVFAVAAIAAVTATTALAADVTQVQHRGDFDHRGGPGFEFRGPDVRVGPGPEVRFGGPEFHGRFLGFGRHFWRGSWYDYGVGPCWALGPDGRYWWVCD